MADIQEKVAADGATEVPKKGEEKVAVDVPENEDKPKRGRRSSGKKSSSLAAQEEAQRVIKDLPNTEVEGRRMTRSAVRGTPPVTPSPPPKQNRKSTGASGGGGKGGKRGRQKKIAKEDTEEEEEEEEEEETDGKKPKIEKKSEENGAEGHGDDDEETLAKPLKEKEAEKMEVEDVKAGNDSDKPGKSVEDKIVNNTTAAAEAPETKQDSVADAATESKTHNDESQVNNVETKEAEEKSTSEKVSNENSVSEKREEKAGDENKAPSEETAPAKAVPQDAEPVPVPVSQ